MGSVQKRHQIKENLLIDQARNKDGLIQGSGPRMGVMGLELGDISKTESMGAPHAPTP